MSSWKLVKPNSLRLFHFNSIISEVEAPGADEFSCFDTLLYEFSVLDYFLTEEDAIVEWCFKEISRLSHSYYDFCFHKCEQDFSSSLNYALVSNIFASHNCWCFDLKGSGMLYQLNTLK